MGLEIKDLRNIRDSLLVQRRELIRETQKRIEELEERIAALNLTLSVLQEKGLGDEQSRVAKVEQASDVYAEMGMQEAVLRVISSGTDDKRWSVPEVMQELLRGGLKTKAENVYSAVSTTLSRLAEKGEIQQVERLPGERSRQFTKRGVLSLIPEQKLAKNASTPVREHGSAA